MNRISKQVPRVYSISLESSLMFIMFGRKRLGKIATWIGGDTYMYKEGMREERGRIGIGRTLFSGESADLDPVDGLYHVTRLQLIMSGETRNTQHHQHN